MRRTYESSGFSLVEVTLATALLLVVFAVVFSAVDPSRGAFQTEPEAADVQQRFRVVSDALLRPLRMAGNGTNRGTDARPALDFFAPILPGRRGLRLPDAPDVAREDVVTLVAVADSNAQTTLASGMAAGSTSAAIALGPGCPLGHPACGFAVDANVAVFDGSGSIDEYTVTSVGPLLLGLVHNSADHPHVYPAGTSRIVEVSHRTFYLKTDAAGMRQLMQYDGSSAPDVPVADHVVGLRFEYWGEPQPPLSRTASPPEESTYGPRPPPPGMRTTAYPPGENCLFARDAIGAAVPRLSVLAAGPAPVRLDRSLFTDGPWCPDAGSPNRFDADLFRVRQIAVTLRVEAAADSLRGPAGLLFSRGGTARGSAFVPDQEVRILVAPRNLNLAR